MESPHSEVVLYFDGGIRQGKMALGYLAVDPEDEEKVFFQGSRMCGEGTSNISEYKALISGLRHCIRNKVRVVHIVGDSQLVIKQVMQVFKVNKPELREHRNQILGLLSQFDDYSIKWVPRAENKRADALVNKVFKRRLEKCNTKKAKRERRKQLRRQSQRRSSR